MKIICFIATFVVLNSLAIELGTAHGYKNKRDARTAVKKICLFILGIILGTLSKMG